MGSIAELVAAAEIRYVYAEDVVAVSADVVLDGNCNVAGNVSFHLESCVLELGTVVVPGN